MTPRSGSYLNFDVEPRGDSTTTCTELDGPRAGSVSRSMVRAMAVLHATRVQDGSSAAPPGTNRARPRGLASSGLRPHRVQRVMPEDEQRAPIRAAEHQLDRTLRHVDAADRLPVAVVHEDLAVGHVDVSRAVGDNALAAAVGERLQVT